MAGNIEANVARIAVLYDMAVVAKADLVVFSEMAITGYSPEDLFLSKQFQESSMQAVEECARMTTNGPAMLVGSLWREGEAIYNAVFLMEKGRFILQQYKHHLPNYGVFDEKRYFARGAMPEPVEWRGLKLGLLICEDMWLPDVAANLRQKGAELLISINASPFETGKPRAREQVAARRVCETGLALIYVNQIGGQDELVFDGSSFVVDAQGEICARLHAFREDFELLRLHRQGDVWAPISGTIQPQQDNTEMIYRAMILGLRDFVFKNGFAGVLLGMSGGIDSALSAALAVDAVGSERVRTLMMPSPYTSRESIADATECAQRLGIQLDTVSIEPGMQAFDAMLGAVFDGQLSDQAVEDNQPRLRGSILMAVSRKQNLLLLNTGNKSEMAVGYTTLYGDMCGHYAVLKDIYKTTVYEVAAWRNAQSDVIPQRILSKAPSAELRPDQTDQDTLPPYAVLDAILFLLVERQFAIEDVVAQGFALELVEHVSGMLYAAEYKRRQSAPGVKIGSMSFGRDRRHPVTNGWHVMRHKQLARRLAEIR
jgi:NAD+ synthase